MIRSKTDTIVIHHSVTPQTMGQVEALNIILNAHKKPKPGLPNGLAYDGNITYHRVIGSGWKANTRPENTVGYHAGNKDVNERSVAVCMIGDFRTDQLNAYQKEQLLGTLKEWMQRYGIPRANIKLHKEVRIPVNSTVCPGPNITQGVVDMLLSEADMSEEQAKRIEELITQVKRLQAEVRKLTEQVQVAWSDIAALRDTVKERDAILDEKRAEIERKEAVIQEQQKQIADLQAAQVNDDQQTAAENMAAAEEAVKQSIIARIIALLFPPKG